MTNNDPIVEYINKQREIYGIEAINTRLRDAGYSQEEIEAAWKAVADQEVRFKEPENRRGSRQGTGTLVALWIVFGFIGLLLVGLTNLGLALSYFGVNGQDTKNTTIAVVNIGSLFLVVGLLVATVQLLKRSWPVGRVVAVVLVTFLLWYTVVLGTCLYAPRVFQQ